MSQRQAVIHDGQADAMPCECPACRSPFINRARLRLVLTEKDERAQRLADRLREARAC